MVPSTATASGTENVTTASVPGSVTTTSALADGAITTVSTTVIVSIRAFFRPPELNFIKTFLSYAQRPQLPLLTYLVQIVSASAAVTPSF